MAFNYEIKHTIDLLLATGGDDVLFQDIIDGVTEAARLWGQYVHSDLANISIEVDSAELSGNTLATGGSTHYRSGNEPWRPGPLIEFQTGTDNNGATADIVITIDKSKLQAGEFYFDTVANRDVPVDKTDFLSVILHELGHGFGFSSFVEDGRSPNTFDTFVTVSGGTAFFNGSSAKAANQLNGFAPIPLAALDNRSHLGSGFEDDLMFPSIAFGESRDVSRLDIAILFDLGYNNAGVLFTAKATSDTIYGFSGFNDFLDGGGGDDHLLGLSGNDTLLGGAGGDELDGGEGRDTASFAGSDAGVNVNLATSALSGGHADGDTIVGNSIENLTGSSLADVLRGDGGVNVLRGAGGNDKLFGEGDADRIFGDNGKDTIRGGSGNDDITGGKGKDILYGEGGKDDFVYTNKNESRKTASTRDKIKDFSGSNAEDIDLKAIDANSKKGGNQKFKFIGQDEFSGSGNAEAKDAGQLRYEKKSSNKLIVEADINGDGKADMTIEVLGVGSLQAGDFVL